MWSQLSARIVEVFAGLFLAGLVVGLLVPAFGSAIGPGAALAIALFCVTGVLVVSRVIRGRGSSPDGSR